MTDRPSNPPVITQTDMRPGDVILSRAKMTAGGVDGFLDKAILALDQGDYTHSSLWDGSRVIEALQSGVQIDDPLSLTLEEQELVDVYRYHRDGKSFGANGYPVEPLLSAARAFKGYGYGYTKLVLSAILLLTCELPKDRELREILKLVEMPILDAFEKWLKAEHSMVCSEVLAQGYWDASTTPANAYGLPVVLDGHRHFPDLATHQAALQAALAQPEADPALVKVHQLKVDLATRLSTKIAPQMFAKVPKLESQTVIGGSPEMPAMFVTPGDLQRSPALSLLGTLQQPAG